MKNFILIAIFSFLTFNAFGQFYDDCATAGSNIDNIAAGAIPYSISGSIPTTFTDDGSYDATASFAAGTYKTGFYAFTVANNGYYNIHFEASGSGATGDLSVGWDPTSGTCPGAQTDVGDITTGFDITSDCVNLTAGTTYYISMALENGHEGSFTITIDKGEDVCEGALQEIFQGDNVLDNSCSSNPPSPGTSGTIWTTYTVVAGAGGETDHLTVDITAVVTGSLNPAFIYQVLLNDCSGDDVTANATCLNVGDVLYIESGNSAPLYGGYTVHIDQGVLDVANDDCIDAEDRGTLTCSATVTGAADANACGGEQDCTGADVDGVWYHFVASSAVNTFDFTGSEFRVWTGPDCATLTELGCAGDAALTDVLADPTTIYWVMVYGSGSFTATSDASVPANDLCADAVALVSGTAVEGSTFCANGELVYCTLDATSHEVYYSYTNNNANTIDLNVAIASSTATNNTTSAVQISVAAYVSDCSGAPFNGIASGPGCNILDNSFDIGCIDPGETIILAVGSIEGEEGDFSITATETVTSVVNDVCAGAGDFGEIASSCQQVDNQGENTGACSDNFNDGGCDFNDNAMSSVWYMFSTDANAEIADIVTDLADASFALYTGPDCDNLAFVGGSCSTSGSLTGLTVLPSTTYYLLIGSASTEGTFNIGITIKNIPNNNLCADAIDLADGLDGTNACADAEYDYCAQVNGTTHEVYYKYTNNNGANVDLDVTVTGNTNTTGTAATGLDVAIMTDACDGTLYNAPNNTFCATLGTQFTIECIEDGETIILVFGSEDTQEGDFGISMTENVSSVANDECSGAEDIPYTACQWESVSTDNTNACFEDFTAVGCDYDTEPVVWMKFTATADATSVEFDNFTTAGTGFLGLFEETADCDNQTEADAGSSCNTGAGPFGPFAITGGNTYYIAVGSSGGEGAIDFDIKVNESPVNDDPCDPNFAPKDIADGATLTEDNTCAGPDFTSCNVDNTTGKTLFYEHTMTQDADLEITVNGTTATGPFTIATYDGDVACGDESNFILDNCTDNTLTLLCKLQGEKVVIMIGTSETAGEFGEYEVSVTENVVARPANDICTDAEEIIYDDIDLCKWKGADNNESNINACSEDNDFGTACDYSHEEVVWFKFTTPPATAMGSSVSVRFSNYTGTGTLFATMFDDGNDCTALTVAAGGGCATGDGPNGLGMVDPNTTYLIGVGSTGDTGGDFDIEIKITSGPPNDDACADMTNFDLTGGGTLPDEQTNACSGAGVSFPDCSGDDQTNAVFYTFTITAPVYGINILIKQSGAEPINGTVVAGISAVNTEFCTGTTYTAPAHCEDISTAEFEWKCLEEGNYQLQISTSDPNSGTFNITVTMIDKPVSECNANDKCDDATELTVDTDCEWVDFTNMCNEGACPDPYSAGACNLSQGPTVWYKVLIPAGATSLDVILSNSGFSDPVMTILDGCPPGASGECATSSSDGATLDNPIDVTGQDGNYYYIAVSDATSEGGYFDIKIKIDVPPINDSPCMTDPRPPYDLGTDGSHSGTTCCAIGYNDDPNSDFANIECDTETDDDAVWYRANIDSDYNGIKISISNGSIGSNMSVEVYSGSDDAICEETAVFVTSECDGFPFDDIKISCLENVDFVFIKVSSSESDCGTFDISVEPFDDCNLVPNCTNLIEPVDGQTNVEVTTSLTWQEVSEASGYYLTIGTEEGLGDILDNEDVGDETTYNPDTLPCNSIIYVSITPYNDYGNAENCTEESFTTEFVIANAGNDVVICQGEETQLQASGGTTYSWSPTEGLNNPNVANPTASPLVTTTYTVIVSNENGCKDSDFVIVNVNQKPVPNVSSTNETGEDTNDGTATSTPYSGQPPYSYIWNTGATSNSITGLSPGIYSVTVSDSNGCSASESVTILEFGCENLLLYATKTDITCFGQCDGKVTIDSVNGGMSPLQYLWSNGDTVSEINNLCQGEYSVTVTDANNCSVFGVYQIISPAELNLNTISTDETSADANDGTATCLPSGGIAPYSYSWSNGETNQSIDSLSPGTYYLTVTDANSCTAYDTVLILAFDSCLDLTVVSQKIDASCFAVCDGVISIIAVNNSTQPLTYNWSNGANTSLINNLCAGDYYVTINDANDCVLVDTITIYQPDMINITVDTVINISNNGLGAIITSIDNKDRYTFNWKGPGNYSSDKEYILNLDTIGCYTLTVTDTLTHCSIDTIICITDKTGTFENDVLNNIKIFPNPVIKNLNIEFIGNVDSEAVIDLYDISGKKTYSVVKKSGMKIIEINTLGINQGIYIVKIKLNDRVVYKKVVISR